MQKKEFWQGGAEMNPQKFRCIRDYSECIKAERDALTGRLMATKFALAFRRGAEYDLIRQTGTAYVLRNEQGSETEFDVKVIDNFFETPVC